VPATRPPEEGVGSDADAAAACLACWADALRAATLLAVDPHGLGGAVITAGHGPVRDGWLAALRASLPSASPVRRVPLHAGDDRLLGGLDLAATLAAGKPIAQRGLLAEADGGVLVLAMAERLSEATAARLSAALDTGEVTVAREGLELRQPARFGVVALDERVADDDRPPVRLRERAAFHIDLATIGLRELDALPPAGMDVAAARARLAEGVAVDDEAFTALAAAALALGAGSTRAEWLALRAARAAAALDGRDAVEPDDLALAARLVLAPRATRVPTTANETQPDEPTPEDPPHGQADASAPAPPPPPANQATEPQDATPEALPTDEQPLHDLLLAAARAAMPAGVLARLAMERAGARQPGTGAGGRAGARREGRLRGRPLGARPGAPRDGARLALIDTLRAAAPWQALRRRERGIASGNARIVVRPADFRITRLRLRSETTTIFAVDASGSSALHRLAEAKGAVELLLADCYVRRDRVAVVAFRGRSAQLLLAPTRSLVRARRELAALPGGGGTPLAAGLDAAGEIARAARQRGGTPVVVVLTDGRANVARDGQGGRAQADADARASARRLRAEGITALLLDTSPQPQTLARELAAAMGAGYLPLPRADALEVSQAVQAAARTGRGL